MDENNIKTRIKFLSKNKLISLVMMTDSFNTGLSPDPVRNGHKTILVRKRKADPFMWEVVVGEYMMTKLGNFERKPWFPSEEYQSNTGFDDFEEAFSILDKTKRWRGLIV